MKMPEFESLKEAVETALPHAIAYIDAMPDEYKALGDQEDMREMLNNGVPEAVRDRDGYICAKALHLAVRYLDLGPREPGQLETANSLREFLKHAFPDAMKMFGEVDAFRAALSQGWEPEDGDGVNEAEAFLAEQSDSGGNPH